MFWLSKNMCRDKLNTSAFVDKIYLCSTQDKIISLLG